MKSYWAFSIGGGNHQNVQRTSHTRRRSALGLSLCSWLATRSVHRLDERANALFCSSLVGACLLKSSAFLISGLNVN